MILLLYVVLTVLFLAAGYRLATVWAGPALSVSERLAVGYLLSGFVVYLAVAAIGPFFLDVRTLAVALAVLSAIAAWRLPASAADARAWAGRLPEAWSNANIYTKAIAVAVVGIAAISLLQGMAPPATYDSLHYHLPLAKFDVEAGQLTAQWRDAGFFAFFPQFMGHQSRLWLMLDPQGGLSQMMHGNMAAIAAIGAAGLARRAGLPPAGAWLAALLVVSNRAVVWQSASTETDTALAAVAVMAMIAFLAWRERRDVPTAALFGLLMGIGVLVKYHGLAVGLAVAPLAIWELARRRKDSIVPIAVAGAVALVAMSPHLIRNLVLVGNPVFPLFNALFNAEQRAFFGDTAGQFGTGRELWDLAIAPWMMSVRPTEFFDGMVFGAPYLLALAPLAVLRRPAMKHWAVLLVPVAAYFVIWFYLLSQQVRFLLPVVPMAAVFCAAGAVALFDAKRAAVVRWLAAPPIAALLFIQVQFSGAYASMRLPPALGLVAPFDYFYRTPTMGGSNYDVCAFVSKNLKPDERYLSFLAVRFYCPQRAAARENFAADRKFWLHARRPMLSDDEATQRFLAAGFRFVVAQIDRPAGCAGAARGCFTLRTSHSAMFRVLKPVLEKMEPVDLGKVAAVYDGHAVAAALRR